MLFTQILSLDECAALCLIFWKMKVVPGSITRRIAAIDNFDSMHSFHLCHSNQSLFTEKEVQTFEALDE